MKSVPTAHWYQCDNVSATDFSAAIVSATEISAPPTDISALTTDISEKDTDISAR